jgi:hypothetical protein
VFVQALSESAIGRTSDINRYDGRSLPTSNAWAYPYDVRLPGRIGMLKRKDPRALSDDADRYTSAQNGVAGEVIGHGKNLSGHLRKDMACPTAVTAEGETSTLVIGPRRVMIVSQSGNASCG